MAITYDAGTNTITIVGYTESTPCTFTDIYNEDVNSGWGVVSRQCIDQFCFACALTIGDGSTVTWFADTDKGIRHTEDADFIAIEANAHFRIGEIVDATKKTSTSGCKITSIASNTKIFMDIKSTGVFEAYSSIISTPNNAFFATTSIDSHINKIWNTIFEKFNPKLVSGNIGNFDLSRVNMESSQSGFLTVGDANDVLITDTKYGQLWWFVSGAVTVRNATIVNETYSFGLVYVSATINLINVVCDKWIFYYYNSTDATIYRQYEFDLKVIDKDNTPINAATIKIWDKDSTLVVDTTTDANGVIATQTITRGYYTQATGDTLQEYSPHLIKIEKAGYTTYEADFTLEEKTDWLIALQTGGGGLMRNPPMTGGMV